MRARNAITGGLAALMAATVPAMGQSPAEQALRTRLPADVERHCVALATPAAGADAAVVCDLPTSVGVTVIYLRFPSFEAAETRYGRLVSAVPRRRDPDLRRCRTRALSEEAVFTRAGIPAGRVGCYRTRANAVVVTLDASSAIVSVAVRPDRDRAALWSWWERNDLTGPLDPAVATAGVRFPNGLERALLLDISPTVAGSGCVRPGQAAGAWIAALRCPLGTGGQVTYRRYADPELGQADYLRSIRTLGIAERTGGACSGARRIERYYFEGGQTKGRYACTRTADGRARLEWLDFTSGIRGIAVDAVPQASLWNWWRAQAR